MSYKNGILDPCHFYLFHTTTCIIYSDNKFSLPRHFVQPIIVATDIVSDVKVSFKSVNIHNNCIVLRDDVPLGCD